LVSNFLHEALRIRRLIFFTYKELFFGLEQLKIAVQAPMVAFSCAQLGHKLVANNEIYI